MILIDSSAGSKDLVLYPPLLDPSLACLANLSDSLSSSKSSVDVCFSGNGPDGKIMIGIEFKSISDLLSSLTSGRLQATQVRSALEEYDICYLLTYGEYRCDSEGYLETLDYGYTTRKDKDGLFYWYIKGIPYQGPFSSRQSAISAYRTHSREWKRYEFIGSKPLPFGYLESAIISLERVGISYRHFDRVEDCAQWIGCCYRSWNKPYDKHKLFRTFDKSSESRSPALMPGFDSAMKARLNFAKELPGMGFERALATAKYFKSIKEMVMSGVEKWLKVPGVGKVIAKSVVEYINQTGEGERQKSADANTGTNSINISLFE